MANPDDIKNKAAQVRANAGSDAKKAKTIQIIGGLVVAAFVVSVDAAGDADSVAVASGEADSVAVAAGVSVFVESLLDCCEATIAVRIATPRSTATSTLFEDP